MKWESFCQGCIGFILLILGVTLLSILKIDLNFISTFLFAIFTIAISIFFYNESTKATNLLQKLIIEVRGQVQHLEDSNQKIEHLNISGTSLKQGNIRGLYIRHGKN